MNALRGGEAAPASRLLSLVSAGNQHRWELTRAFGPLRPLPGYRPPELDYLFILYTNRCGSNFLAQALASTGLVNEAGENFNAGTILQHARERGLDSVQAYFSLLPSLVDARGLLAAKLAIEHVEILQETGIMEAILPRSRFILIERQDRLSQAVSRCIAWQNEQWTSEQPKRVPDDALVYSRRSIEEQLHEIGLSTGLLYRFLAGAAIAPVHLSYERLVREPQAQLDEIADRLGLPRSPLDPARIRLRRQGTSINDGWRRRYLAGC